MSTVGSIGIGLFILILVWILALLIFVFAVRNQSNFGWFAVGTALLFTIIIIFIPVEKQEQITQEAYDSSVSEIENTCSKFLHDIFCFQEKDYAFIYRTSVFSFLLLSVLLGSLAFFVLHCIEPVRSKSIKTFK